MACLRLLTRLPLRPLVSVPLLRFFIARSTYLEAPLEYRRAILSLLKQTILVAAANVIGLVFLTAMYETLFRSSDSSEAQRS
jgi:hypothetical protein